MPSPNCVRESLEPIPRKPTIFIPFFELRRYLQRSPLLITEMEDALNVVVSKCQHFLAPEISTSLLLPWSAFSFCKSLRTYFTPDLSDLIGNQYSSLGAEVVLVVDQSRHSLLRVGLDWTLVFTGHGMLVSISYLDLFCISGVGMDAADSSKRISCS
jgi:hypothetical protein